MVAITTKKPLNHIATYANQLWLSVDYTIQYKGIFTGNLTLQNATALHNDIA